jgi:hypothetical protein
MKWWTGICSSGGYWCVIAMDGEVWRGGKGAYFAAILEGNWKNGIRLWIRMNRNGEGIGTRGKSWDNKGRRIQMRPRSKGVPDGGPQTQRAVHPCHFWHSPFRRFPDFIVPVLGCNTYTFLSLSNCFCLIFKLNTAAVFKTCHSYNLHQIYWSILHTSRLQYG